MSPDSQYINSKQHKNNNVSEDVNMSPLTKGLTCQNLWIFCRGKQPIGKSWPFNLGSPFHENDADVNS